MTGHPERGAGVEPATDPVTTLEGQSWALAAVIATMRDAATTSLDEALSADPARTAVLEAAGLVTVGRSGVEPHPSLRMGPAGANVAAARLNGLRQAVAAAAGAQASSWDQQPDHVLLDQGRASAAVGRGLAARIAPQLPGLATRLAASGRVLDVGTGVGALALALVEELPHVHVTGIDVLERAIELARRAAGAAGPAGRRVELRVQDVADLDDGAVYDLVWLPVPFLSEESLVRALQRIRAAVVDGGWLVAGTNPPASSPLSAAVARWNVARSGGNSADTERVSSMLLDAGWCDLRRLPTVPGGPVIVAAQHPGAAIAR